MATTARICDDRLMGLPRRDGARHTYADYRRWPDDVRCELIAGEVYAMAPAPSIRHQEMVLALVRQIADALEGGPCRPFVAPVDVRLPLAGEANDDVDTVVQPDILVVCDRGKVDSAGVRGAPDWIIEVLSPSTAGHDQVRKRDLYERHGVREYWTVHPIDNVVTVMRLDNGRYREVEFQELVGRTVCTAIPAVAIDWDRALQSVRAAGDPALESDARDSLA